MSFSSGSAALSDMVAIYGPSETMSAKGTILALLQSSSWSSEARHSIDPISVGDFWGRGCEGQHYRLPHLFYGYGYWVVSGVAADILRTFDLGRGGLYPVRVLKKDRRTC